MWRANISTSRELWPSNLNIGTSRGVMSLQINEAAASDVMIIRSVDFEKLLQLPSASVVVTTFGHQGYYEIATELYFEGN